MNVHYMSNSNEWETPQDLFDKLDKEFHFTLDPCATKENAKCKKYFTKEKDGIRQIWKDERVFMNPPYGREIGEWMKKAYEESTRGCVVVCLVPARTDTNWWWDYAMKGEIRFIRGRVRFKNPNKPLKSSIGSYCSANLFLKSIGVKDQSGINAKE